MTTIFFLTLGDIVGAVIVGLIALVVVGWTIYLTVDSKFLAPRRQRRMDEERKAHEEQQRLLRAIPYEKLEPYLDGKWHDFAGLRSLIMSRGNLPMLTFNDLQRINVSGEYQADLLERYVWPNVLEHTLYRTIQWAYDELAGVNKFRFRP